MDTQLDVVIPVSSTVVKLAVAGGDMVEAGATVAVVEVMKSEHVVVAPESGRLISVLVAVGDVVPAGAVAATIDTEASAAYGESVKTVDEVAGNRADLSELRRRENLLADDSRPDAVAKVHARNRRTARENLADLVDTGSFDEYGRFMYAAQTARRNVEELMAETPGDGIIGGLARINGDRFGDEQARAIVMSYDYTVLAGTQGFRGHQKKDRLLELADRLKLPVVLFAEGGGGRPGDTDVPIVAGLNVMSFAWMARLSGQVPTVAVVSGRCFAGNAALAAVCDVIIATEDANLGMAGPAMVSGGGLGDYSPEAIGPMAVQELNGVVDLVVADDAAAVSVAKRYLGYFQGRLAKWEPTDQVSLRAAVPENRKRVYDVRAVLDTLADVDSVLELRPGHAPGMVTALARFEGRPVGVIANDPAHLGGAVDGPGAAKAARFLKLCDAHGLPVISLCDTPGFMVGPEAEESGQARVFGELFVAGAQLSVPLIAVVLRKAVGLGAMAMAGGSFHIPVLTVSWPTGEVSGMGIEGAVRLGARRELETIDDPAEREEAFEARVAAMYRHAGALNAAAHHEVDDVIDPAETRSRIINTLRALGDGSARA